MKDIMLYYGDCLEEMGGLADHSVEMILTDLPYGTTANKWDSIIPFDKLWEQYERIITDNGVIALFGDEPFASHLRLSKPKLYRYDWIWIKNRATGFLNAKKMPLKNTETVSIFYKHLPIYNPKMTPGKPYVSTAGLSSSNYRESKKKVTIINKGVRYPKQVIRFNVVHHTQHPTQKTGGITGIPD